MYLDLIQEIVALHIWISQMFPFIKSKNNLSSNVRQFKTLGFSFAKNNHCYILKQWHESLMLWIIPQNGITLSSCATWSDKSGDRRQKRVPLWLHCMHKWQLPQEITISMARYLSNEYFLAIINSNIYIFMQDKIYSRIVMTQ